MVVLTFRLGLRSLGGVLFAALRFWVSPALVERSQAIIAIMIQFALCGVVEFSFDTALPALIWVAD